MLCSKCAGIYTDPSPGRCSSCSARTPTKTYRYCEQCSLHLGVCQLCTYGIISPSPGPGHRFVKKYDRDDGGTATLAVGEELHVTLAEDLSSRVCWAAKSYGQGILSLLSAPFLAGQGNSAQGTRTTIFQALAKGTTKLEMQQIYTGSGARPAGQQSWSMTVRVK